MHLTSAEVGWTCSLEADAKSGGLAPEQALNRDGRGGFRGR